MIKPNLFHEDDKMLENIKFPIGLRIIKTGLAVFLCILFAMLLDLGSPALACLAAVFTMRQDMNQSLHYGSMRIAGVFLAGAVTIMIILLFPLSGAADPLLLALVPLGIVTYIFLADKFHMHSGIIVGCATMFIIMFDIPTDNQLTYALKRLALTVVGVAIALIVNKILPNHYSSKV